jgi:hypothetical protein
MRNDLINLAALEIYLRSARPSLMIACESKGDRTFEVTPYISEVDRRWDEVILEGFDPDRSPLGCPVYWREVKRGDERFCCSTFLVTRDQTIRVWGIEGLSHCDPATGIAIAQTEGQAVHAVMEMVTSRVFPTDPKRPDSKLYH